MEASGLLPMQHDRENVEERSIKICWNVTMLCSLVLQVSIRVSQQPRMRRMERDDSSPCRARWHGGPPPAPACPSRPATAATHVSGPGTSAGIANQQFCLVACSLCRQGFNNELRDRHAALRMDVAGVIMAADDWGFRRRGLITCIFLRSRFISDSSFSRIAVSCALAFIRNTPA